jgi:hypothetical protein
MRKSGFPFAAKCIRERLKFLADGLAAATSPEMR